MSSTTFREVQFGERFHDILFEGQISPSGGVYIKINPVWSGERWCNAEYKGSGLLGMVYACFLDSEEVSLCTKEVNT